MSTIGTTVEHMFEGMMEVYIFEYIEALSNELDIPKEKAKKIWINVSTKRQLRCPYTYKQGVKKGETCKKPGVYCGYCYNHKTDLVKVKDQNVEFAFVPINNY